MKTLKQLGLSKHHTSNFADYLDNKMICCGWMDIHEDSDSLGEENNKIFKVKPLYWNDDGCFCIKIRNKWRILPKDSFNNKKKVPGITYEGKAFCFDATKYHCFVPRNIAANLNNKDYQDSAEYSEFEEQCGKLSAPPVLVWEWSRAKAKSPKKTLAKASKRR